MTFDDILAQVITLLKWQGRVSYPAIKIRFSIDDEYLEALLDVRQRVEDALHVVKRTPSSRQKRARMKIVCYRYEPKYIAAGV
jgi:hypothetical protein